MVLPDVPGARPARRAVLAGALAGLAGAALAGCSEPATDRAAALTPLSAPATAASPTAAADQAAAERARTAARDLVAAARRLSAARPALARVLADVVRDHEAHLSSLGTPAAAPGGASPSASGPSVAAVVAAERAAAQQALDDVSGVSPGLAALLARVAASRAVHADLIAAAGKVRAPGALRARPPAGPAPAPPGPATPAAGAAASPAASPAATGAPPVPLPGPDATGAVGPTLPAEAREALVALTAGEHAAVFAYGVVAARVAVGRREEARQGWAWHRSRRDLLEERLLAADVPPPAAAPAYDVGGAPGPAAAARLAATVETRLAALAARAVATTEGQDRRQAAEVLVQVARHAAGWSGRSTALPG